MNEPRYDEQHPDYPGWTRHKCDQCGKWDAPVITYVETGRSYCGDCFAALHGITRAVMTPRQLSLF